MKNFITVAFIFLCPFFVLSQNVEVLGGLKANTIDANGGLISNVADPLAPQDAATKAYVDANSTPTYTVGLSPEQGGYIFWVSADGKHGLVAETIDQSSSSSLSTAQDEISNPANHSADGANFRDWRMPTSYELNEMYTQKASIGGFTGAAYWNSSGAYNAQYFARGAKANRNGNSLGSVRSVRSF